MASPVALICLMVVIAFIIRCYIQFTNPKVLKNSQNPDPFENALSMYIFMLTSLFTFLLSIAFAPFRCYPQSNGTYSMIPKPSEGCYDATWNQHLLLIIVGMIEFGNWYYAWSCVSTVISFNPTDFSGDLGFLFAHLDISIIGGSFFLCWRNHWQWFLLIWRTVIRFTFDVTCWSSFSPSLCVWMF